MQWYYQIDSIHNVNVKSIMGSMRQHYTRLKYEDCVFGTVVSNSSVFPPVLYSAGLNIAPAHFFNYLSLTKLNANWCIPLIGWL